MALIFRADESIPELDDYGQPLVVFVEHVDVDKGEVYISQNPGIDFVMARPISFGCIRLLDVLDDIHRTATGDATALRLQILTERAKAHSKRKQIFESTATLFEELPPKSPSDYMAIADPVAWGVNDMREILHPFSYRIIDPSGAASLAVDTTTPVSENASSSPAASSDRDVPAPSTGFSSLASGSASRSTSKKRALPESPEEDEHEPARKRMRDSSSVVAQVCSELVEGLESSIEFLGDRELAEEGTYIWTTTKERNPRPIRTRRAKKARRAELESQHSSLPQPDPVDRKGKKRAVPVDEDDDDDYQDEQERSPKRLRQSNVPYLNPAEWSDADAEGENDEEYIYVPAPGPRMPFGWKTPAAPSTSTAVMSTEPPVTRASKRLRASTSTTGTSRARPFTSTSTRRSRRSRATGSTATTAPAATVAAPTSTDAADYILGRLSFPAPIRRRLTFPDTPGHVNFGFDNVQANSFVCSICSLRTGGMGDLSRHVLTHIRCPRDGYEGNEPKKASLYRCSCGNEYARLDPLKRHADKKRHVYEAKAQCEEEVDACLKWPELQLIILQMLVKRPDNSWASVQFEIRADD
ncbi:hypothetical protein BD626DRAFT_533643 [Schizophyllum amplum]|uniref:Uncharacterized protein n=1 Tax=Schizophyllum amplum TaxID=97359 RepID=A0A550CZX4_9AGAR|nr:hypothetical protein BD626DRAFT_533643 [Auriculariopsis ampla]